MNERNLKLILQYDGTQYHGFQIQPDVCTIQKTIEDTLFSVTGEKISITGCSRTDAGVHAYRYCCSFKTTFPIPANRLPIVLNHKFPSSIKAIDCMEVSMNFNARFDTVSKTYRYIINTDSNPSVFTRNYEWQISKTLNVDRMRIASKYLIGTHDFRSFMTSGGQVQNTIRTVYSLTINEDNQIITLFIKANGYLYNMVRIIVGTLVNVGIGILEPENIKTIINSQSREQAGPTAPPQGLALFEIEYKDVDNNEY